jgi:transposase-like protein
MMAGEGVTALAAELGIRRKFLYAWKEAGRGSGAPAKPRMEAKSDPRGRQIAELQKQIAELERLAGQQSAELDFFAAALRNIEGSRPNSGADSGDGSMPRSKAQRKAKSVRKGYAR